MKYCWMSPIILSANSVEKMQVFCPWSSLRISACTVPRMFSSAKARTLSISWCGRRTLIFGLELRQLLLDRGIQVHRQDDRRRAVDGHRYRGRRAAQVEAVVKRLHVGEGGDRHPGITDLAVDIRAFVRVAAVQGDRIKSGRQAFGRGVLGNSLKRRLVRNASPSPANMRVGSSPSRLKAKTPAVKGKLPGRFSSNSHFSSSPWSS